MLNRGFSGDTVLLKAYPLVVLFVSAWCAWAVLNIGWLAITDAQEPVLINDEQQQSTAKAEIATLSIQTVSDLHLFGRSATANKSLNEPAFAEPKVKAPETRLKLKLVGVRYGSGDIRSSVIIEGGDKKQVIYYVGDELPVGGARVAEIFSQHVTISRQGKHESLTLFDALNTEKDRADDAQLDETSIDTDKVTDFSNNQFLTKKINRYRQIALEDPMALSGIVRVSPILDGERFIGYLLNPGTDKAFFRRAGLVRGDLLTSLNGIELDSPSKALSIMASLAVSNDLDIIINRNGEQKTFRYKFK